MSGYRSQRAAIDSLNTEAEKKGLIEWTQMLPDHENCLIDTGESRQKIHR